MKKLTIPLTILLFAVFGCDKLMKDETILVDDPELQAFSEGLNTDVGLSKKSINALNDALNRHGKNHRRDPAFLWKVAVELQNKITSEEKDRLLEWMDDNAVPYLFSSGMDGGKGRGGPHGDSGGFDLRTVFRFLTDDQKDSLKSIMDSFGEKMKAVQEQVRDGSMDKETAQAELEALMAAMKAEIAAILTDEQKEKITELKSQMEAKQAEMKQAAHDAMVNALKMSETQESDLESINQDYVSATKALFEKAKAENMDRQAIKDGLIELIQNRNADIEALFDDTQMEIIQIYTALGMQYSRHCGNKGRDGKGGPGGGNN
ncbi:MAG: hypothetical protein ISR82_07310 [Candidatus Marinimicrobia bacterium]|nr:hypothetical protein [Candidatus Neomarinimicrobiota bacterium]MBL7011013.1 hypothetical protein [Candidatus Neomarinimicrobiota bacterium]MBL7031063.1 hypothetical protein [Candidatus Neomarinimicrobiota bacterium]